MLRLTMVKAVNIVQSMLPDGCWHALRVACLADAEASRTRVGSGRASPQWVVLIRARRVPARFKPFTALITALQECHDVAAMDAISGQFLATFQDYARGAAARFGLTAPGDTAE